MILLVLLSGCASTGQAGFVVERQPIAERSRLAEPIAKNDTPAPGKLTPAELESDKFVLEQTAKPVEPLYLTNSTFSAELCPSEPYSLEVTRQGQNRTITASLSSLQKSSQVQVASAVIECLWCPTGAPPPPGKCKEYDCGGDSGVHYYTCCNPCDEDGQPGGDTPEYDGASDGNYCGVCGANLGGGCDNSKPFTCGGPATWKKCKAYCDRCAITFPGACWNWSLCFDYCCKDGNPADGVDGWICMSL